MKKVNLAIIGCLGRMGQQLIKSSKKSKKYFVMLSAYSTKALFLRIVDK